MAISSIFGSAAIADSMSDEASKGLYVTLGGGVGRMMDIDIDGTLGGGQFEFDSGFSGDAGIGYDFGSIRTEFNYNALNTDLSKVQTAAVDVGVNISSWFISAAYDFRSGKTWQPYLSAGLGKSVIDVELATTVGSVSVTAGDDDITTFLGKAGLTYALNDRFELYGEGWLQRYEDFSIGTLTFTDTATTGLSLGTRIKF